ncbi:neuromedin Bb [Pseudochaenichthys georgianus]|uniref:neuromedin Bb n=1 Tax=Pseudochaenichthys georgianus TaxID=52239 RepID=UPI00146DFE77|nr:neuromedin Bb [Pseudochaenichthys georgianus]
MRGFSLNNVCQCGLFAYLLFFSFMTFTVAVSFDLTELRNKVAKIKVNPRGNLWATGHFMGKKSVMDPPLLSSEERQGVDALEVSLPAEQSTLTELFHQFLRVNTQERSTTNPDDVLMKIIESYIQSRK